MIQLLKTLLLNIFYVLGTVLNSEDIKMKKNCPGSRRVHCPVGSIIFKENYIKIVIETLY